MGSPAVLGLAVRQLEEKSLAGEVVQAWWGLFCMCAGNLGGETKNGGGKNLWYEAQLIGEQCLKEELSWVRLVGLLL